MQASSAAQLFQSDDALAAGAARAAKAERTNAGDNFGAPIWPGMSADGTSRAQVKIISAALWASRVWAGTSTGALLCIDLEQGTLVQRINAHRAPLSALGLCRVGQHTLLFSGSWDRAMNVWAVDDGGAAMVASVPEAAGDFIKTICVSAEHRVVLTGGSDKSARLWDISALIAWTEVRNSDAPAPTLAAVIRNHTRPVTAIAVMPHAPGAMRSDAGVGAFDVFTADSMGRVVQSRISDGRATAVRELDGNETAVTDMRAVWRAVDASAERLDAGIDYEWAPDVWTASADKHVRRFPLAPSARESSIRGRSSAAGAHAGSELPIRADRALAHPESVGAVLPLGDVVVTTCDGDIWTWSDAPVVVEGHAHEVAFLGVWERAGEPWVVSAGLDGSVRRWALQMLRGGVPRKEGAPCEGGAHDAMLTAEEEAELAELM